MRRGQFSFDCPWMQISFQLACIDGVLVQVNVKEAQNV